MTNPKNQIPFMLRLWIWQVLACGIIAASTQVFSQSVCLPAPRLLTTMPMGARQGVTIDVRVNGQHAEEVRALLFSHESISAQPKQDEKGKVIANQFVVTVKPDCPLGIHEARIKTRLGVSTARGFSVGDLPELIRTEPNTSLQNAMLIPVNSICNAFTTRQSIDYYRFEANKDERIFVECAAQGIDSKLKPVVIVADENGADLVVERRSGALDFEVPANGTYSIKVHDLTYAGSTEYFYRLAIRKAAKNQLVTLQPSTRNVNAFSWPPYKQAKDVALHEVEPNDHAGQSQVITLPCHVSGSFFPAADVDTFEFEAKKGETWWVEVASERLGRPTDPTVVVQHIAGTGNQEKVTDIAELTDIPSPIKVSSNGYSYDGPPYNAGSSDIIGSFTVKNNGTHRLLISDLFGGTRRDPRNIYHLIIRKAQPDFAIVGWSLHMNLRNGDRNALSKPLALRRGGAIPIEVVVVRRDGFNAEIELSMENLPAGVSATGMKIPAGGTRGYMIVSADPEAPAGFSNAKFYGTAEIAGEKTTRECHWASMRWPVPNAWSEIPNPRLINDIAVSVTESEYAPLTLAANEEKTWEVTEGEKLSIPLVHTRRCDFQGANISLRTFGNSFSKNPVFDAPLSAEISDVNLDLSAIKAKPGEYHVAFYGSAVAKYRYNPKAISTADSSLLAAKDKLSELKKQVSKWSEAVKKITQERKSEAAQNLEKAQAKLTASQLAVTNLEKQLKLAKSKAAPKDIVDIIVSKPIKIRVIPMNKESKK